MTRKTITHIITVMLTTLITLIIINVIRPLIDACALPALESE